jgi:hypothetical protein
LSLNFNTDIEYQAIHNILGCQTAEEIKTAVSAFIAEADKARAERGGKAVRGLCKRLTDTLANWLAIYKTPAFDSPLNVRVVPPVHALALMLSMNVPLGGTQELIIGGLKRFLDRCDEFTAPIEDAVTPDEIEAVLEAAERSFKIISLIAPKAPLCILRMNNSHIIHNSECGVPSNPEHEAVILVFHPREVSVHDRVFIFAHELGHALHLALTHDVNVLPDKFDDFNAALGVTPTSASHKPEMFADAAAYAILGDERLREHLPKEFLGEALPYFKRYLNYITATEWNKRKKTERERSQ